MNDGEAGQTASLTAAGGGHASARHWALLVDPPEPEMMPHVGWRRRMARRPAFGQLLSIVAEFELLNA